MKTLKLTSLFILLSILSMGMGFPDLISEKDIAQMEKARIEKKQKKASAKIGCPDEAQMATGKEITKQKSAKSVSSHPGIKSEISIFSRARTILNNLVGVLFGTASKLLFTKLVPANKLISEECSSADLSKEGKLVILQKDTIYNQAFTCN